MKIETKNIVAKLQSYLSNLKKYITFIFVITVMFIFSFFIFRINQISRTEPSDLEVEESFRPYVDPKLIKLY